MEPKFVAESNRIESTLFSQNRPPQTSAVAHGTVIDGLISKGKMRYSTSRFGKTNEYFGTKLDRRDNVGKIYKLTKLGAHLLRNGASTWW